MKLFQRKQTLAQAFKLPQWGQFAEETPPKWLVTRIQNEELLMNSLGGFSVQTEFGCLQCAAGDYVVLNDRDMIEFCKAEVFEKQYELLDPAQILTAA